MACLGPEATIACDYAKTTRSPLGLSIGHTGDRCDDGNSATGPFQLHDGFHKMLTFIFRPPATVNPSRS